MHGSHDHSANRWRGIDGVVAPPSRGPPDLLDDPSPPFEPDPPAPDE